MSLTGRMGGWAPEMGAPMLPPSAMPKIDTSPEAQLRWARQYLRRRYGEPVAPWQQFVNAWRGRPLTGDGLRALEVLRLCTGQWMEVGRLMRRGGVADPAAAFDAIRDRGVRLEFTRTPVHREPVIAYAWREASGSALLRVRLA